MQGKKLSPDKPNNDDSRMRCFIAALLSCCQLWTAIDNKNNYILG